MGLLDRFKKSNTETAALATRAGFTSAGIGDLVNMNGRMDLMKAMGQRSLAPTVGIPDLGFKGARQQLFQRFNLIDLYGMAYNNSTVRTATSALKQEVFRRGLEWQPAFVFRCETCGTDFDKSEIQRKEDGCLMCSSQLNTPNPAQRVRFEKLMPRVNIYGQSFIDLLETCEDDLNIVDDLFIYMSSEYKITPDPEGTGSAVIIREIKQLFRLDPIFVEFDTDDQNRPGFAHHVCLAHRQNLLDVPADEGWEHNWQGKCEVPNCGLPTFPVIYRYVPTRGTYGAQKGGVAPGQDALYLVKGEVVHKSKFAPSELYGYSPLLSVYEKVLSLIGMDRFLYDYFFERQMPQGVITTVTDNPDDLETRKEQIIQEVLNNPHYIPWLAVSSRAGQGKTEFIRFAYSLDELQFLPVQDSLERATSGVYGVPGLFMGYEQSYGGLNNQSQEITRMSRGAQMSQQVYNAGVIPDILEAFGVTDWILKLSSSNESEEAVEWDLRIKKSQWAQGMVAIGFGVKYSQEDDEYQITGEVKSQEEQQEDAMAMGGMDMGGGMGIGGGGV